MYRILKSIKHGVKADFTLQSQPGVAYKFIQQNLLIELVKSVYNFVGIAYKTVNGVNRITVLAIKANMPILNEVL